MIMRANRATLAGIRLCFNRADRTSFSNRGDSHLGGNLSFILDEHGVKGIEISYVVVWGMASMINFV